MTALLPCFRRYGRAENRYSRLAAAAIAIYAQHAYFRSMKYLPILLFAGCLACNNTATPVKKAAKDSVLYSPLILPLTDSIQRFPGNANLYFRRALLLFNTDPALAQADFEKAAQLQPTVTDHWAGAGEAALITGHYKAAGDYFEKALQTAPENTYLQYRLAMAWIETKQYPRADSLAAVMQKKPDAFAQAFYLKARMAEDHGDTAQAIGHLETAVAKAGKQSEYEAVMELADLLRAHHNQAAVKYYEMAFAQDPTNADPLYDMAQYYQEQQKIKEATATYKRCIEADPGYAAAYIALGRLHAQQQQWKPALNYFTLAARAKPTDAEAYYYRGLCYEQLGNKKAARDDYSKALTFRKSYPEAKAALERVK
ncbi:MAG TPA: tetratricopeptide repeat protein [Chitinophaga sp.]|uniref:tetratricopeptide repeat protein n=1 Tax=Chitinophaga sp. TaxID=1869181 RepID=UPI002DB95364|nr:tetratricopeptide repeat protein [Chitinophaga sp.]HEU4556061.1 tetratricopeptide repeat protein [Chitinophaga sp.]